MRIGFEPAVTAEISFGGPDVFVVPLYDLYVELGDLHTKQFDSQPATDRAKQLRDWIKKRFNVDCDLQQAIAFNNFVNEAGDKIALEIKKKQQATVDSLTGITSTQATGQNGENEPGSAILPDATQSEESPTESSKD